MIVLLLVGALAADAPDASAIVSCSHRGTDDIVVCGSRGRSRYRLPELPERYEARRIRAEGAVIPGVNGRVHVDSVTMPDGNRSNRLMVTFSTAF